MTVAEVAYLAMVVVAMSSFAVTLAWVTKASSGRR